MDKIVINGGRRLHGRVEISGSKNSALPVLAATLLTDETCRIGNVPRLKDIETVISLLEYLGKKVVWKGDAVTVSRKANLRPDAPYDLVRRMRASVLVMGPLLARLGSVKVSVPGGCAIGARPIDIHLEGFRKLGARIDIRGGYVILSAGTLEGGVVRLRFPSVGATENLMIAATCAGGNTVNENAAREAEIQDLAAYLNRMGADIKGAGTSKIRIGGNSGFRETEHVVIPDRIETGTFMIAAAMTGGKIRIEKSDPSHVASLIGKLKTAGVCIRVKGNTIHLDARKGLRTVDVKTSPYPGFPTDMQAQWMAFMCTLKGRSVVTETVFENRFLHVAELCRMGADIALKNNTALVYGGRRLSGAQVMASDLRASAALVLAGLVAEGRTEILRIYHLDRGYEHMEKKLRKLGADIRRIKE